VVLAGVITAGIYGGAFFGEMVEMVEMGGRGEGGKGEGGGDGYGAAPGEGTDSGA
jgi:hypothetical protein